MTLNFGDTVRWRFRFYDFAGVPADPTTVNVKTIDPALVQVTLTYGVDAAIVKDSTGVYHYDQTPTVGDWQIQGKGSGSVNWVETIAFNVLPTSFT